VAHSWDFLTDLRRTLLPLRRNLDTSFSGDGKAVIHFGSNSGFGDAARDLAMQGNKVGRLQATGISNYLKASKPQSLVPPSTSTPPIIVLSNRRLKVYESRCIHLTS
jgi:hypothetical protein